MNCFIKKGAILVEDSQLLRGVLEGCVLAIIKRGETYGYEIIAKLEASGFNNIQEGTLYPVLTRLEKKVLLPVEKQNLLLDLLESIILFQKKEMFTTKALLKILKSWLRLQILQ